MSTTQPPPNTTTSTSTSPSTTTTSTTSAAATTTSTTPTTTSAQTTPATTATTPTTSASTSAGPTTAQQTTASQSNPTGPVVVPTTTPGAGPVAGSSGTLFTSTSLVTVTPTGTGPATTGVANQNNSGGFFQRKGQVAGVFSAVGVVALIILAVFATSFVRRRRAKKFDLEVEEAAAEAASAPAPVFLDDDGDPDDYHHVGPGAYNKPTPSHGSYRPGTLGYDQPRPAAGGPYDAVGAYPTSAQYSDVSSHGTYTQPPMNTSNHAEMYNMREIPGFANPMVRPGEVFSPFDAGAAAGAGGATGAAGGAAGVGVARSRSLRDPNAFAAGLQDGSTPYAAFAGPGYNQAYQSPAPPPLPQHYANYGSQGYDVAAQAVALDHKPGMSLDHNEYVQQQQQQQQHQYHYLRQAASPPPPPPPPQPQRAGSQAMSVETMGSVYSASTAAPSYSAPNPYMHAPVQEEEEDHHHQEEHAYGGYEEEEEEEERPRVLKVANE